MQTAIIREENRSEPTSPTAINVRAPILLAGEIEIAAAPELVWDVLTAIDDWPSWNSDVRAATLEGELAEGSIFRWRSGTSLTSTITHVEPPRLIRWTGTSMGLSAVHVYELELREGKTLVRTEESAEAERLATRPRPVEVDNSARARDGERLDPNDTPTRR